MDSLLHKTICTAGMIVLLFYTGAPALAQAEDQLTQSELSNIRQLAIFLVIPFVAAFSFVVFLIYRQRREADIQQLVVETELKALRAQMNPHFIFNCLNSIFLFVRDNRNAEARQYLLKFSALMRKVLDSSAARMVSLQEDLNTLELYIEMEKLRTDHRFNHTLTNHVAEAADLLVPPLITQPFVENSIWHGFASVKSGGELVIDVARIEDELRITITDNGTLSESEADPDLKALKKASFGTVLTHERLDALNKMHRTRARFTSSERHDEGGRYCGREVVIYLPCLNAF